MSEFKKKKHTTLNLALIALVLSLALVLGLLVLGQSTASTSFSLQFEGIERGINPDNTRFDYQELISENFLKVFFTDNGLEYKPEYQEAFEVTPVLPKGIVNEIKNKRIKGEDFTYFPNEFVIKIHPLPKLGLTKEMSTTLASAYRAGFEKYFVEKNTFPFMDLQGQMGQYDLLKYDYPEYSRLFDSDFNRLISYLDILERDDPEFTSPDGLTFRDLKEGVQLVKRLDIQKMNSIIDTYQLSKNKDQLKIKYLYMIRRYNLEKDKDTGTYQVSQDLLNIVKQNNSTVLLPGVGGETMSISIVNDTYDVLASKATTAQVSSVNINEEILYIQKKLVELDTPTESLVKISQARKEVDELAKQLPSTISLWVDKINTSADAYFDYKYTNVVTSVYDLRVDNILSPLKAILLAVFIWLVLMVILLNFSGKHTSKKSKTPYRHVGE